MNECCIAFLVRRNATIDRLMRAGLGEGLITSARVACPQCRSWIRKVGGEFKSWSPALLSVAKAACHESGLPWTDPTTDITYLPERNRNDVGRSAQAFIQKSPPTDPLA